MEVGHEEFRTAWVGEELFRAYHAVLGRVIEIPDFRTDVFEAGAPIDEVVPCAVSVSAFACVGFFRKIFPESAGVIGCEGVACREAQSCGGGMSGWGGVAVQPEVLAGCEPKGVVFAVGGKGEGELVGV